MAVYEIKLTTADGEIFTVLAEGGEAERIGQWMVEQGGAWVCGESYYARPLALMRRELVEAFETNTSPVYVNEKDIVKGTIRIDLDKARREVASKAAMADLFGTAQPPE